MYWTLQSIPEYTGYYSLPLEILDTLAYLLMYWTLQSIPEDTGYYSLPLEVLDTLAYF